MTNGIVGFGLWLSRADTSLLYSHKPMQPRFRFGQLGQAMFSPCQLSLPLWVGQHLRKTESVPTGGVCGASGTFPLICGPCSLRNDTLLSTLPASDAGAF